MIMNSNFFSLFLLDFMQIICIKADFTQFFIKFILKIKFLWFLLLFALE